MDLSQVPLNEYGHVQTRDGRPVRLLCRDVKFESPIVVAVQEPEGNEHVYTFHNNGKFADEIDSGLDLIPVPRKVRLKGWVNVYATHDGFPEKPHGAKSIFQEFYWSRDGADRQAGTNRIACICIDREVTEGEGL